jgi:hypothetical protein
VAAAATRGVTHERRGMHIAGRREVAGARQHWSERFRPISAKSNLVLVAWTVVEHARPDNRLYHGR